MLGQAAEAYGAALEVFKKEDFPKDWARTQVNLGNVTGGQAGAGPEGIPALAAAAAAYSAALEVYNPKDDALEWAMTQANLGLAYEAMAERSAADAQKRCYRAAIARFDAALTVFDPTTTGPNHARTSASRARVAEKLARL